MFRKALIVGLALLASPALAAPTFFWRAESGTLDSTHDFSAGDTSATSNGGVSFSATAVKVGTNGILTTNAQDYYIFDPTSIFSTSEGAMGGWIQVTTALPSQQQAGPIVLRNSGVSNAVFSLGFDSGGSGEARFFIQNNSGSSTQIVTSNCNMTTGAWYFLLARWHSGNNDRELSCYDSSGALLDTVSDLSTSFSSNLPTGLDEMRVGNSSAFANPIYVDNVFVSQTYAEPIQNFLSITSWRPSYSAGPTDGTFTTTTLPFIYTPDQTGTSYAAACTNGQTISTGANVEAGTCSGGAALCTGSDAASAGVSNTLTITGCSAGTTHDVYMVHKSSLGSYSAVSSLADKTTTSAGVCNFDSGPSVTSQTTSAYTIAYDATASCDVIYCMAKLKDASTPSAAAVEAGTSAHGTATEATTGSADTLVLTPSESDKFPVYDLYCVLKDNPSTYTSVAPMLDEFLDPQAGRQWVIKSGSPGGGQEGILDGASPAAANDDVIDVDTDADSFAQGDDAHPLTVNANTTYQVGLGGSGDTSRQTFTRRFYDVSAGDWSDSAPVLYCVNNEHPVYTEPDFETSVPYLFEKSVAMSLGLDGLWADPESDELTHTTANLPTGLSDDGETVSGTPTTFGYYSSVELTAIDECTDETDQTVEFVIGLRLPDVTSWLLDETLWKTRSILTGAANDAEYDTLLPRTVND